MSSGALLVTSLSPTRTWPDITGTTPTMLLSSVLLPEPFGPTIEATSPGAAVTERPWITGPPPQPPTISSAGPQRPRRPGPAPNGCLPAPAPAPQTVQTA